MELILPSLNNVSLDWINFDLRWTILTFAELFKAFFPSDSLYLQWKNPLHKIDLLSSLCGWQCCPLVPSVAWRRPQWKSRQFSRSCVFLATTTFVSIIWEAEKIIWEAKYRLFERQKIDYLTETKKKYLRGRKKILRGLPLFKAVPS